MLPSGLRIAGTTLIAAPRRTAPPGPPVSAGNAGYAAVRSPAGRMSYAQQRGSDTIRTCAIMRTDFALRVILDSPCFFFATGGPAPPCLGQVVGQRGISCRLGRLCVRKGTLS